MEQIPIVQGLVNNLSNEIDGLETKLEPLLKTHISQQKFNTPKERAEFYTFLAYALDSVIFAYLKSKGEDTSKHEIVKELERVKSYMAKVKQHGEQEQPAAKPATSVDKQAAARIVKHHLNDNDDSYLAKMARSSK